MDSRLRGNDGYQGRQMSILVNKNTKVINGFPLARE